MKLMDKNGRFFGKVHFFDILVAILLIVGVVLMSLRLLDLQGEQFELFTPAEKTYSAEYVVELRNAKPYHINGFEIGETLYENGFNMGTVIKKEVRPSVATFLKSDGTLAQTEHTLLYDVFLTIKTDCMSKNKGYYIGDQELLNGTTHSFYNAYMVHPVVVREIRVD